jgi:hemerythrin-like metal-binding protein
MTNIEIFPWNTNFETGIPIIDEQHKKLIDLLNLLISHIAYQSDVPTLNLIFDELKEYTQYHFSTEEKIWQDYFYDDAWVEWHKHAHADFISEVIKIKEESHQSLDETIEEIVKFLTHWLAFHILDSDKRMAKVVLALPSGISLTQAKIHADQEMSGSTRILIETIMGMYDQLANRTVQMTKEINKRKEVEAELQLAKEKAEAANIAKSTFISTMSHELRTPLNAILGFSELMSRDDSITAKQKEMLDIINNSGTHLLEMINDVLDISKIEAGKLSLNPAHLDLISFLKDIADLFSLNATEKKLRFTLEIDDVGTKFIVVDSGKLRQILSNLLSNAIKFTHQGEIVFRVYSRPLSNNAATLFIEVKDTGVGLAKEAQERIFQPFFQLVQKNADVKGTGLGLAISKSLVELMGGKLSFISELEKGTSFTIELPVTLSNSNKIEIKTPQQIVKSLAPNQSQIRLLVVDDNREQRLLLTTALKDIGFLVNEATNGEEAIAIFEQWHPDLIFMDLRMPVLDGYEATIKIRQTINGDKVKIIALTASVFTEQHAGIIQAGCNAVLHKPFHLPDIFAILTEYLGVEFRYKTAIQQPHNSLPALTPESLQIVPESIRRRLNEAAMSLDVDEINVVISEIYTIAPEIADVLKSFENSYQFEKIVLLTEDVTINGFYVNKTFV